MSETEGDLYDELVNDSYRLCRQVRTAAYWIGWLAVVIAVASLIVFFLVLWPEQVEAGGETFFGSGGPANETSFRLRLEWALRTLPGSLGFAGLVGALAAGLRLMARRLELDLVTEYSDDDE